MCFGTDFEMTMENNEQAIKAVKVIKEIAAKRTLEYPEELTEFIADIEIRDNMVLVEGSCSLFPNTCLELIPEIMKACAALTQASFKAYVLQTSFNCGFLSLIDTVRSGDEIEITTIVSENGNGTCPECGETVVYFNEYDPNATYYCPECGEEMDHLEMFEGCLPEVTKETVKISK